MRGLCWVCLICPAYKKLPRFTLEYTLRLPMHEVVEPKSIWLNDAYHYLNCPLNTITTRVTGWLPSKENIQLHV